MKATVEDIKNECIDMFRDGFKTPRLIAKALTLKESEVIEILDSFIKDTISIRDHENHHSLLNKYGTITDYDAISIRTLKKSVIERLDVLKTMPIVLEDSEFIISREIIKYQILEISRNIYILLKFDK